MTDINGFSESLRSVFGENLRSVREKAKLSQAKLAEIVGLCTTSISEMECGKKGAMLENAVKIATALGVSLDYLCGDHKDGQPQPPKIKLETLADLQELLNIICDRLDFCDVLLNKDLFGEDDYDTENSADIYLRLKNVPQLRDYYLDYSSIKNACRSIPAKQADRIVQDWKTAKTHYLGTTKLTEHDFPF